MGDLTLGVCIGVLVWCVLPARWLPVDLLGSALALLWITSGVATLLRRHIRSVIHTGLVATASLVALGLGLLGVGGLCAAMTHLWTIYGWVGRAGTAVFALVLLAWMPYFVVYPCYRLRQVWQSQRLPAQVSSILLLICVGLSATTWAFERAHSFSPNEQAMWSQACEQDCKPPACRVVTQSPLPHWLPAWLIAFGVVPLRDGLGMELNHEQLCLTPNESQKLGFYEHFIAPMGADTSAGFDWPRARDHLLQQLGKAQWPSGAKLVRLGFAQQKVSQSDMSPNALQERARLAADYLVRHQDIQGRFTYLYDPFLDQRFGEPYSLARHAGAAYFLAEFARFTGQIGFADAASRAILWMLDHRVVTCGPAGLCVLEEGQPAMGASAILAIAIAELLQTRSDSALRLSLGGLIQWLGDSVTDTGHARHAYDRSDNTFIESSSMFVDGQIALALLRASVTLQQPRLSDIAGRILGHVTGPVWSFFGSRYYYGEEHWTCMAGAELPPSPTRTSVIDFCLRWADYNELFRFQANESSWAVAGALGTGPFAMPRLAQTATRAEALLSLLQCPELSKSDRQLLRTRVEGSARFLAAYQWTSDLKPQALGGFPASPADLTIRNDYVQHAGSVLIRLAFDSTSSAH